MGALAGLAGGLALLAAERLGRTTLLPAGSSGAGAVAQAAAAMARARGAELSPPAAMAVGAGAQLAYCALWGAAYGVLRQRLTLPALVDGLLLAGAAYATASSTGGLLPRLGAAPAMGQAMDEVAVDLGAQLAFGITTASVFEATA